MALDQLELRLETHDPGLVIVGPQLAGVLLHGFVAALLKSALKFAHRGFKLLIRELAGASARCEDGLSGRGARLSKVLGCISGGATRV